MAAQRGISNINLIPKDSFEFSVSGRFLKWATTGGRVLVVLTEFVVLLAFASRFYFDKKLNDLSEVLDQKQAQIVAYKSTEDQMRKVLAKQLPIDGYLKSNLNFEKKVTQLEQIMPTGVKLENFSIAENTLTLAGQSVSELGFVSLLRGLKKMDGVSKIDLKDTNFDQATGAVKFSIQMQFK